MNADSLLSALFNVAIAVSILATVMSLGLSFSVAQLIEPLRRVWLVAAVVVLNTMIVPALAWWLFLAMGLPPAAVVGLALTTVGAAGAVGLKASQLSKGADLPLAVTLVIVLQLVNLLAVPLWVDRMVAGATVSPWEILKYLCLLVLAPLAVGLAVRARFPQQAAGLQPALVRVSSFTFGAALVAGVAVNWGTIVSLAGSRVMMAAVLVPLCGIAAGFLVGGRNAATRTTTGLVSGVRFTSLGLIIIGTQLNGNPRYLGPALVFALVNLIVALVVSLETGRRAGLVARTYTTSSSVDRTTGEQQ